MLRFTASTVLTQCVNITIIQDGIVGNTDEFFSVEANSATISVSPAALFYIIENEDRKRLYICLIACFNENIFTKPFLMSSQNSQLGLSRLPTQLRKEHQYKYVQ